MTEKLKNISEQIESANHMLGSIESALHKIAKTTYDKGARYILNNVTSDLGTIEYVFDKIVKTLADVIEEADSIPVLPGEETIDDIPAGEGSNG